MLGESSDDPAALVCRNFVQGLPSSSKDVQKFAQNLDVLIFESELIPPQCLKALANLAAKKIQIFPAVELMATFQNRKTQKQALQDFKIATSPWLPVENVRDLKLAAKKFGFPFVLKKSFGGYDGYGTFYARGESDLSELETLFPGQFIAEEWIPFKRELALAEVRDKEGQFVSLPLVHTQQTDSRCDWVLGPIASKNQNAIRKKMRMMMSSMQYVGILTFELFETKSGQLLVNEVAPRVHNSGHHSQDSLSESQFLLHIKACLGQRLRVPTQISEKFCMVNLLATQTQTYAPPHDSKGFVHWYHKDEGRKGRKMGHINFCGKNSAHLLRLGKSEQKKWSDR